MEFASTTPNIPEHEILTLSGKICNSLLGLRNLNVEIQNPLPVSRMPSLSRLGKWLFSLTVKKKIYYGYMRLQLEESFSCINYYYFYYHY